MLQSCLLRYRVYPAQCQANQLLSNQAGSVCSAVLRIRLLFISMANSSRWLSRSFRNIGKQEHRLEGTPWLIASQSPAVSSNQFLPFLFYIKLILKAGSYGFWFVVGFSGVLFFVGFWFVFFFTSILTQRLFQSFS